MLFIIWYILFIICYRIGNIDKIDENVNILLLRYLLKRGSQLIKTP